MNDDLYGLQASGIDPAIAAKMIPLQRQQAIAEALLKQSMQPINVPQGTKIHPLQGVAQMVQAYMARRGLESADAERGKLSAQNAEMAKTAMGEYETRRTGLPGIVPATPNDDEGNPMPARAEVKGDPRAAIAQAMSNPLLAKNPLIAADLASMRSEDKPFVVGRSLVDKTGKVLAQDETWAAEQEATRLSREEAAKANREAKAEADRQRATDREGFIRLAASLKPSTDKTPMGYRMKPDGTMEAVPGGPADTKLQGVMNQDTAALGSINTGMDRLALEANKLLTHPGLAGITGIRGKIPNIPGTDAADAQAILGTLKSQIGFSVLQDMRNNSKTGGALGSVSDKEGDRLERNLAALDNAQSLEQFKKSLGQVISFTNEAKSRAADAFNMKHKGGTPKQEGRTVVERRTTPSGKKLVKYSDGTIGEE